MLSTRPHLETDFAPIHRLRAVIDGPDSPLVRSAITDAFHAIATVTDAIAFARAIFDSPYSRILVRQKRRAIVSGFSLAKSPAELEAVVHAAAEMYPTLDYERAFRVSYHPRSVADRLSAVRIVERIEVLRRYGSTQLAERSRSYMIRKLLFDGVAQIASCEDALNLAKAIEARLPGDDLFEQAALEVARNEALTRGLALCGGLDGYRAFQRGIEDYVRHENKPVWNEVARRAAERTGNAWTRPKYLFGFRIG